MREASKESNVSKVSKTRNINTAVSSHSRAMSRDGCGLSGHAVSFPMNCRHFEEESHVGELLQAKGDPTLADHEGTTPIYMAVQNGHLDCLRFLLEAGAGAPTGGRETTARPPRSDGRVSVPVGFGERAPAVAERR